MVALVDGEHVGCLVAVVGGIQAGPPTDEAFDFFEVVVEYGFVQRSLSQPISLVDRRLWNWSFERLPLEESLISWVLDKPPDSVFLDVLCGWFSFSDLDFDDIIWDIAGECFSESSDGSWVVFGVF